ncbi:hypothetical protein THMIRHAS_00100 [Thiosulfatimonas sediminis]|uniref:PAS fold-4 domain-containing protein n=1 Tax=Thiosulfatimonas sediminis TaxID=2675054 RepID=A0A6F8PRH8_9GAMM|nr:hypothetical protein [Thiosulfatimonas sediminis]BBP44637.1 hypothetical protein THMIRHAS_00100 [Thiosulfatimonas sediminis]
MDTHKPFHVILDHNGVVVRFSDPENHLMHGQTGDDLIGIVWIDSLVVTKDYIWVKKLFNDFINQQEESGKLISYSVYTNDGNEVRFDFYMQSSEINGLYYIALTGFPHTYRKLTQLSLSKTKILLKELAYK